MRIVRATLTVLLGLAALGVALVYPLRGPILRWHHQEWYETNRMMCLLVPMSGQHSLSPNDAPTCDMRTALECAGGPLAVYDEWSAVDAWGHPICLRSHPTNNPLKMRFISFGPDGFDDDGGGDDMVVVVDTYDWSAEWPPIPDRLFGIRVSMLSVPAFTILLGWYPLWRLILNRRRAITWTRRAILAVSLSLGMVSTGVWITSNWKPDWLNWSHESTMVDRTQRPRLEVSASDGEISVRRLFWYHRHNCFPQYLVPGHNWGSFGSPPKRSVAFGGFRASSVDGGNGCDGLMIVRCQFPFWLITAVFGVLAALSWLPNCYWWGRRRRRLRQGLCLQCGYNLTGNESGVCPECGSDVKA